MSTPTLNNRREWQPLKESGRISVYRACVDKRPVVVKEYSLRSWLERLSFYRKVKTVRAFYADGDIAARVAPSLMAIESDQQSGRLCYDFIEGRDFRHVDWTRQDEAISSALMEQSADLLALLHARGWIHGDFKFGNLLRSESEARIYLLDIEGLRRSDTDGKRARDLARFLLNGLELEVPARALQAFWKRYESTEAGRNLQAGKVKKTLNKLARRHQQKYGRRTDPASLSFL
jgi:tRNA A-37 threonylcarbamoyl transferase component Bud32